MEEICKVCGSPIKIMINRDRGYCSENCRSILQEQESSD